MRLKRLNKLSAFSFNLPNCEHVSSMPRSSSKVIDCFRWILAHTKVCLKMPFKCGDTFGVFVMCVNNNTRTIQTILPRTPFDWSVYSNVLPKRPYTEFEILSISRLKMSFTEKKFLLAHKMLRSEYEKIWPNWNFEQSSKCQSPRKKIRIYDVFSKHHFTLGLARWHGCDREKIYSTLHGILVKSNNEAVCAVCWNVL